MTNMIPITVFMWALALAAQGGSPARLKLWLATWASLFVFASVYAGDLAPELSKPESMTRPNVVIIYTDDMSWSDVGYQRDQGRHTPAIDALAQEGMVFRNGYSASPMCSPARIALHTGKLPTRIGTTDYIHGDGTSRYKKYKLIPPVNRVKKPLADETCLAEPFQKAGYKTCFIGKGHMSNKPSEIGFTDEIDFTATNLQKRFPEGDDRFMERIKAEHACEWIAKNRDNPFFLIINTHAVHTPIGATPKLIETLMAQGVPQQEAFYQAMCMEVDLLVEAVRTQLKSLDLAERTILIFSSDNGGVRPLTDNRPFRGGKSNLYEGGVRVPFIVHWPGVTKPGSASDALVVQTDIYPTLLEACGLPAMPEQTLDGMSLVPILRDGTKSVRDSLFWHYPHYTEHHFNAPSAAVRQGNWKMIEFYEDGKRELYNLTDDPGEQQDLSSKQPERVADLASALDAWRTQQGAKLPNINPDYDPNVERDALRAENALDKETLSRLNPPSN